MNQNLCLVISNTKNFFGADMGYLRTAYINTSFLLNTVKFKIYRY